MSEFEPDESIFDNLKGKVVVLSGGATGIGAATVSRLHTAGASVVFGDIAVEVSEKLASSFQSSSSSSSTGGNISFAPCDVTKYGDIYNLFKTAFEKYGRVDHAVSCAGVFEQGQWFDPGLTVDTVGREPGPQAVIDVNVMGSANFARVAVVFLRDKMQKGDNKSLTFLSSVNAFRESPGLYMYQTSKHAIQGLMRSMRKPIFERDGIRVNCVCPGVTESPMTAHIIHAFKKPGLFFQPADDIARMILGLQTRTDFNGKAIYVEGGNGWEFEESFYREQPRWLGEEPTRRMRANSEAVQKGALTAKSGVTNK